MNDFPQDIPYQTDIKAYCQRVVESFKPDCIILHGSVARGEMHQHSDIDILVIGGEFPKNFFQRLYLLNRLRTGDAPIEAVAYSMAEWEQMMKNLHLTVLEALEWGVPLYGEPLFATWKAQFENWKRQGLKRNKHSWAAPASWRQTPVA
ncbi:MAG: nucleotidyltransferase domain-containing protein [Chloroflexi bacterium]|nr:nucleotidyltransferase domain-containing protein [Chloroflexota bacterium]